MKKIVILCGPTASGKTAAAIEIAQKIGAEIISADSGQVYRGMDIGTAKPTPEERAKIPLHLIDILNPDQQFSAADFCNKALEVVSDIQSRGKRVIIAGGTGLYFRALEQGLFKGPSRDQKVRSDLEREIKEKGIEAVHKELEQVDPEAAKVIPARNRQRLIRALEVYRLTGRPISAFWNEHRCRGGSRTAPTFIKFGLNLPKEELHRRIEERVDRMIGKGLLVEVEGLLKRWGRGAPGLKIIGYKEIVDYLQAKISLEKAIDLIKTHTRQYAKRQMTWFNKDKSIRWGGWESEELVATFLGEGR